MSVPRPQNASSAAAGKPNCDLDQIWGDLKQGIDEVKVFNGQDYSYEQKNWNEISNNAYSHLLYPIENLWSYIIFFFFVFLT